MPTSEEGSAAWAEFVGMAGSALETVVTDVVLPPSPMQRRMHAADSARQLGTLSTSGGSIPRWKW